MKSRASSPPPTLVPPGVSRAKLDEELADWRANDAVYRRRGWWLLGRDGLTVEVAFVGEITIGDIQLRPVLTTIRLDYTNYDLWAPSLTFIDITTREPTRPALLAAERVGDSNEIRNALLDLPDGRPFLCLPGLREYHDHPQHTGDSWLLHRTSGAGRLAVVCDQVWRRMVRNVMGIAVQMQTLPRGLGTQLTFAITQGDVDIITNPSASLPVAIEQ